jgi:GntR family transcriptional regulator, transcriptional repressor for pyruvate dehydrogenase complex
LSGCDDDEQPDGSWTRLNQVLSSSLDGAVSLDTVFATVRSTTAFEETVDRLGTAIRLGLLPPGTRLPAERELCLSLGIARSTLRQALTALTQGGYLHALRGRGGGTFVVDVLPPSPPPPEEVLRGWRDSCDRRISIELGVAVLAARRARPEAVASLRRLVDAIDEVVGDFPVYRQLDVRWHVELAEATDNQRLVAAMTEIQGVMTDLVTLIAHPAEVLAAANHGHRRVLGAIAHGDEAAASAAMLEHLRGTEHIIGWLLPGR